MKRIALVLALLAALGVIGISVIVELEGPDVREVLASEGTERALILYHPSRDAHFSDDLSLAFANGLRAAGFAVDRATITSQTPARPQGYALVAVVSNTYYWAPDLPTLRYLKRARLDGMLAVGLIGGAGSTGRSQRLLDAALRGTGARVFQVRALWLWRPNDENRLKESNRKVALELATQLGAQSAQNARRQN